VKKKRKKRATQNGWKLGDLLKQKAEEQKRQKERMPNDSKSTQKSKDKE